MNKIIQILNENKSKSINSIDKCFALDSKTYDINWDDGYQITAASKGMINFYSKHASFTVK